MAEWKQEEGDAPASPAGPPSLAAQVADAAAARLLIFDELSAAERPRPGDRVLLVGIVWGGTTLVELETVPAGGDLTADRLFDLPGKPLPKGFKLVKRFGAGHVIALPESMPAEVHGSGHHEAIEKKGWPIQAPFRGTGYEIGTSDRIVVQLAPRLTLIARYVREARLRERSIWRRLDASFALVILLALIGFGFFFRKVMTTPVRELSYAAQLQIDPERYARYQVKPQPVAEKPVEKPKEPSGLEEGEKAKADEGKLGKEEAKQKEAAPSKKGAPEGDKRAADLAKIRRLGLISALGKLGVGLTPAVLGPGGAGTGINASLGGRGGVAMSDAYGTGLGTRGTGPGGGGKALGIGGLGTKGEGSGAGGYGRLDLGGRGKEETIFVPGKTTVVGGLTRDVINRVMQKHYSEIKYCYGKGLGRRPSLEGKVTVLFVIDDGGKVGDALVKETSMADEPVETCMIDHLRRWIFPAPQGGGSTQVTYPYVFKSTAP